MKHSTINSLQVVLDCAESIIAISNDKDIAELAEKIEHYAKELISKESK